MIRERNITIIREAYRTRRPRSMPNPVKRCTVSGSVFHLLSKAYKDKCELLSLLPSATRALLTQCVA